MRKPFYTIISILILVWVGSLGYYYVMTEDIKKHIYSDFLSYRGLEGLKSNHTFTSINVVTMTPKKLSNNELIVVSENKDAELIVIYGKYTNFEAVIKEIRSSSLLIEEFYLNPDDSSVILHIRVREVSL